MTMPRTLLVMRHAKSSWKDETLVDHDRPLSGRGKRDAPRMGRMLKEEGVVPDLIVSSTARRASRTAAKVADASGCDTDVRLEADLYHAGPDDIADVLRRLGGGHGCVMIVGHNPGLEAFCERLTGRDERLPTAAVVRIDLDIDSWRELDLSREGRLAERWLPRELG